jgi:hypothetical protein
LALGLLKVGRLAEGPLVLEGLCTPPPEFPAGLAACAVGLEACAAGLGDEACAGFLFSALAVVASPIKTVRIAAANKLFMVLVRTGIVMESSFQFKARIPFWIRERVIQHR